MSFSETLSALVEDGAVLAGLLVALAVALVGTPLAGRLALVAGGVDAGGDRPRIHTAPTPNTGGVAIVLAIVAGSLLFVDIDGSMAGIFLGLPLVALLGFVDDRRGVRPRIKLLCLTAIVLIPVAGYGLTFDRVTLPLLGDGDLGWIAYPLTILWIVLVANLVNLIDGMDALAAGIVAIAAATLALMAVSFGRLEVAVVAAAVSGATLGFLWHNYHPAKIFMGDSGALSLGYLLAALSVEGLLKTPATITLLAPLLIVAVPLLDTSFVVLKRLKYRRPPFGADHNHFYHRFLRIGFSQRRTAAYLHVWAAALAAWALLVRFVPPRPTGDWDLGNSLIVGGTGLAVVAGSVWMIYTLEILKFRRLDALRLRRTRPAASEAEIRSKVEQDLETGEFEAVSAETGEVDAVGR
ncbi:MAG: undecaprenyl/decaprenyl-phosphate alpha-N-acetylglucosaminyl 1-phosphate transferase [Actinomycetota bacterium]|nr:undecaprenyl/decaprenyl-phosphate alpha-N-acetylglucosaminyl 1-phosphate transferase [Actinomycetota bacterium]